MTSVCFLEPFSQRFMSLVSYKTTVFIFSQLDIHLDSGSFCFNRYKSTFGVFLIANFLLKLSREHGPEVFETRGRPVEQHIADFRRGGAGDVGSGGSVVILPLPHG